MFPLLAVAQQVSVSDNFLEILFGVELLELKTDSVSLKLTIPYAKVLSLFL